MMFQSGNRANVDSPGGLCITLPINYSGTLLWTTCISGFDILWSSMGAKYNANIDLLQGETNKIMQDPVASEFLYTHTKLKFQSSTKKIKINVYSGFKCYFSAWFFFWFKLLRFYLF